MRVIMLAVLSLSAQIQQVSAQSDTLRTQFLDEVVISASRSEQSIGNTPRSMSVVDQKQIDQSTYNSVGDLLARQEGIYLVGANQTPGTNQALFLRGANSNQVLVMIDGVRITDPSSPNNAVDLSEFSLTQVERIEIVRGSHSTEYGSGAIGGVVNIITKRGTGKGLHGAASFQGGSFGEDVFTLSQQADVNYSAGNGLYVAGGIFNQQTSGLNASLDTASVRFQKADRDDFSKTDGNIKIGYKHRALEFFAGYRSTHQRTDIDNGAFSDDDNNYLSFYRNFWNYGASYKPTERLTVTANGSISNSRRLNENDSSLIAPDLYDNSYFIGKYYGDLATHEVQADYAMGRLHVLMGIGNYRERMNFNTYFFSSAFGGFELETNYDSIDSKTSTDYVFGQIKISPGKSDKLNLVLGARYSDNSFFGSFVTYEVSPSYSLNDNTLLFGSYSTGFNAPSLYQLYDPTQSSPLFSRGNSDLKPEESQSVELGLKKSFSRGQYMTASLFSTRTTNAIEYVYVWNKNQPIPSLSFLDYVGDTYINLSSQQVYGAEVSGLGTYGKFAFTGNFTWMKGMISSKPADAPPTQVDGNHVQLFSNGAFLDKESRQDNLARRPRLIANAQLKFDQTEALSLFVNYRVTGSRNDSFYDPTLGPFGAQGSLSIKSYNLIDLGAIWKLNKALQISSTIENIFDTQYQEINGFATRGRSFYLKLILKW